MTTDTRQSIAELEAIVTKWDAVDPTTVTLPDVADDLVTTANAVPVLVAIARAAQAHIEACDREAPGDAYWKPVFYTRSVLRAALAGVSP